MSWWPCSKKDSTTPPPPPPNAWQIQYSPGTPPYPETNGNGFSLDFPTAAGASLHYVVRGQSGAIGGAMEAAINLIIPDGVVLSPVGEGDIPPCKAVLYFQRRGDNMSGQGEYQFFRWWSKQSLPLTASWNGVMSVPLLVENWGSVMGVGASDAPGQFTAALADIQGVGMTFGGAYFAGHGLVASGASRIEVSAFNVG